MARLTNRRRQSVTKCFLHSWLPGRRYIYEGETVGTISFTSTVPPLGSSVCPPYAALTCGEVPPPLSTHHTLVSFGIRRPRLRSSFPPPRSCCLDATKSLPSTGFLLVTSGLRGARGRGKRRPRVSSSLFSPSLPSSLSLSLLCRHPQPPLSWKGGEN